MTTVLNKSRVILLSVTLILMSGCGVKNDNVISDDTKKETISETEETDISVITSAPEENSIAVDSSDSEEATANLEPNTAVDLLKSDEVDTTEDLPVSKEAASKELTADNSFDSQEQVSLDNNNTLRQPLKNKNDTKAKGKTEEINKENDKENDKENNNSSAYTDTWYVQEFNGDGQTGYTAMRTESMLNELVFDIFNIIGEPGRGSIQDYYAVEAAFSGEGDAADCNIFSGFSKGGEYWKDVPIPCGLVIGSDAIDIGDIAYTNGPFERTTETPKPLTGIYEMYNILDTGDDPDFLGTWYGKDSNGRLYEFEFMENRHLVYACKADGRPIEIYSGSFSYDRESGVISCVTNKFGWGTMPFMADFKLNLIAEGKLSLSGELFSEGELLLDTEPLSSANPFMDH